MANTDALRTQGLSGRLSLPDGAGMLFVFDQDDEWGIWMKDMRFSIDIVWIDAEGSVVEVVERATPETYPHVFAPRRPARYVLELPAGYAARNGIAEGIKILL